jgi:hypothetical protein
MLQKIVTFKKDPVYTENAFEDISEAFHLLELAFRLQKAFDDGLIDEKCFTRSIEIDTGTGTRIKEKNFALQDTKLRFHNLVLSAMATLVIAVDRGLDETYSEKQPDKNDNINSLRNFFYMLRCAFAHDIAHPQWQIKGKYRLVVYQVIIPKDIVLQATGNANMTEVSFQFNFENLDKKTVDFNSFHGIDGLICLTLYALSLVKKS